MSEQTPPEHDAVVQAPPPRVTKSQLIRDLIVFQVKLFVDGLRDVVLIPVSFVAGIISLVRTGNEAGSEFYEVVAFGRQTERSINLFEAADRIETSSDEGDIPELDGLVGDVERYVRDRYEQGQFDQLRQRLQGVIDTLDSRKRDSDSDPKTST